MANKRKDTMEIKQILLLNKLGYSNRKIADQLGMSRNTVNGYMTVLANCGHSIEELTEWSEDRLLDLFPQTDQKDQDRYEQLLEYFPEVLRCSKLVGFTYQKMWESYRQEHNDGYSYTQFLAHYHNWNNTTDATLKLQHKAGEQLMADYAGKKLHWIDRSTGQINEVEVFIGSLPASGLTFVQASPTQRKEDYINSMIHCLNYLGGAPQVIVSDNLKSAVSTSSKYEPVINRTFRDMAMYYGCVLNPTRPRRPKDKALVERMVRLVYEQIYFPMRNEIFFSLHQLNERIRDLVDQLNDKKSTQLDCSRRELFLSIEKPLLSPLPPQPYQIKKFKRAKVQKTSHVYLSEDKHYYSVPYRYIGKSARIHYTDRVVEIYYDHQRIATHFRDRTASGYTTKKEHLPSHHQFFLEWTPEFFLAKARQIGPNTTQYIQRLFNQDGPVETKYKTAMGIVQLIRQYETDRIEQACQLAMLHPVSSYRRISNILEKGLDQQSDLFALQPTDASHIPPHDNIRGPHYYSDHLFT